MKLYHYSKTELKEIKNSEMLGLHTKAEMKKMDLFDSGTPYPYYKQTSYFLEPIPITLASLYKHKHHFWRKGVSLKEHIIELPIDLMAYLFTETPGDIKRLKEGFWGDLKDIESKKREVNKIKRRNKEIGFNNKDLIKTASLMNTGIRDYYIDSIKEQIRVKGKVSTQYAPSVPHVMIYIDEPTPVSEVRTITLV